MKQGHRTDTEMGDLIEPDQRKQLTKLRKMVSLLETNTVTNLDTLKKIDSCLQMMPIAEIPNSTFNNFERMPPELKCKVLEHLETTELLIVARVSKECTALVKKIVEEREEKRKEEIKLGINIWSNNELPVEQVETLLRSLADLSFKIKLRLSRAVIEGLVEKVGLKLVIGAVMGVRHALVEMHFDDHLRELLSSMGGSNMQTESLTLQIPSPILDSLPGALLLNLTKLNEVSVVPMGLTDYDFTKVLLTLTKTPFQNLKSVFLYNGSILEGADSVKITEAITSLDRFSLSEPFRCFADFGHFAHFAHFGALFTALASSNSKLMELRMISSNCFCSQVDTETLVAALTPLKSFSFKVFYLTAHNHSEAQIGALEEMPGVSVHVKANSLHVLKG